MLSTCRAQSANDAAAAGAQPYEVVVCEPCCQCDDGQADQGGKEHQHAQLLADRDAHLERGWAAEQPHSLARSMRASFDGRGSSSERTPAARPARCVRAQPCAAEGGARCRAQEGGRRAQEKRTEHAFLRRHAPTKGPVHAKAWRSAAVL